MIEFFKFTEIIVSILLIFFVLIQNKNVNLNLSSMSWWMSEITKRWPEKVLHNMTILLWFLFILNSTVLYIFS